MSVLDLFRFEARAVSDFANADGLFETTKVYTGENVSPTSALRLVSVYACITLISDAVRAMPVDVYEGRGSERQEVEKPDWMLAPNRDQTWGQFIDYGLNSLLTRGNMFTLVSSRGARGAAEEVWVLHPDDITVDVEDDKKVIVHDTEQKNLRQITAREPEGEVLHIMGHTEDGLVGLSPVEQAAQAIGWGLATEKFGSQFFGQGALPGAVVQMPAGSNPTPDQLKALGAEFRRKYGGTDNAWKPVVLANGAEYKPIMLPNDQAQFIESRKFSVSEIARLYRVPPHMIGDVEKSTSWGSGIEEQGIGFVTYTLMPWITRLEEAFSLLVPDGQYVKFNQSALLRGDQKGRFETYQLGINNGIMSPNEARSLEDLPPMEGLDTAYIPLNLAPANPTEGNSVDANAVADAVGKFIRAGFTPESSITASLSGDFNQLQHTGKIPITIKDEDE